MDEEKLRFALNTQSPEDIDVISIELVADDFHCRYAKHSKTYEFIVDRGRPKIRCAVTIPQFSLSAWCGTDAEAIKN